MTSRLPTADTMALRILDAYRQATPADCAAGRDWYPAANRIVRTITAAAGSGNVERTAFVLAALSPRNPWRWNVFDTYAFITAAAAGHAERPSASTFNRNADTAWRIATGDDSNPWSSAALKVRAFVDAILGNEHSVVIDSWAFRLATDGLNNVRNNEYAAVEAAYRRAADTVYEAPRDMQAITWLVARSGAANTTSFKAGTPTIIRNLF